MDSQSSTPHEESPDETPEFLESEPTTIDLWNALIRVEKKQEELLEAVTPMAESFNAVKSMVDNFTDSPMAQMVMGMAGGNTDDQPIRMLSE